MKSPEYFFEFSSNPRKNINLIHYDLCFMEIGIRDNNKEKKQNEVLQTLQKL